MSLIKQFAGQTVVYGISTILSKVVYVFLNFLLAKLLGENTIDFGVFAFFYGYSALLITLFSFRLDTALFRYGNKTGDLKTAFNTTLTPVVLCALSLVIIGVFFAEPIADILAKKVYHVRLFAIIIALDIVNLIPFAKLRLQNKGATFAKFKVFNVVLSSVLILFFLLILPKFQGGLLSFVPEMPSIIDWFFIANLFASAVLFILLLPVMKGYSLSVDKVLLKKMLYYVSPLVIVGICNAVIQFFGVQLQERLLSGDMESNMAQAGIYDFTRKIAGLFIMFTTAFNYAAEPFFFNNSSEADRKEMYGKICRLFTLVGGLVVLCIYLGMDLLKLFNFGSFLNSMNLLPVLLMAYLFLGIYYNVSIWYKLSDNTKYGAFISIIGLVVTLVISIVFLPRIGYAASAWATLASYFIMVVLGYFIGQAKFPISYPVGKIVTDLFIIAIIMLLAQYIRAEAGAVVKYLLFVVIALAYVFYMWKAEPGEWRKILRRA